MLWCIQDGLTACRRQKFEAFEGKPRHKIPYNDLRFFCGEGPRSRRYGRTTTLRLLVQSYNEEYYYYYYYYPFPSTGAMVE
jgi:hypothetical protein